MFKFISKSMLQLGCKVNRMHYLHTDYQNDGMGQMVLLRNSHEFVVLVRCVEFVVPPVRNVYTMI